MSEISIIQANIDPQLRASAEEIFKQLGLTTNEGNYVTYYTFSPSMSGEPQWQGKFTSIKVIGDKQGEGTDKQGEGTTLRISSNSGHLQRLR